MAGIVNKVYWLITWVPRRIRVGQGFWIYGIQGLLNRVYGILQLKYGYSVYHFLWISGINIPTLILGIFGWIVGIFGYFGEFFSGILVYHYPPPSPPPWPTLKDIKTNPRPLDCNSNALITRPLDENNLYNEHLVSWIDHSIHYRKNVYGWFRRNHSWDCCCGQGFVIIYWWLSFGYHQQMATNPRNHCAESL